jgi:hypothetical protein
MSATSLSVAADHSAQCLAAKAKASLLCPPHVSKLLLAPACCTVLLATLAGGMVTLLLLLLLLLALLLSLLCPCH